MPINCLENILFTEKSSTYFLYLLEVLFLIKKSKFTSLREKQQLEINKTTRAKQGQSLSGLSLGLKTNKQKIDVRLDFAFI